MGTGCTPQGSADLATGDRRACGAGRAGFGLAASLVLLALLMFPARAPAATVPSGLKALPAGPTLVEPVARRSPYGNSHSKGPSSGRHPSSKTKPYSTYPGSSNRRPRHPPTTSADGRPHYPDRRPTGRRHRPHLHIAPGGPGYDPPEKTYVERPPPRRVERPPQQPPASRVERQILVLIDQSRPQSVAVELARAYGLQVLSSRPIVLLNARATLFRVPAGRSEDAALVALQRDPRVRSAQFNMRYLHSDDRRAGSGSISQYGPRNVKLPDAHRLALGRNVTIAVIDSAVDATHPDLKGVLVHSFDVVGAKDAAPDFHGTAVAGIIGSRGVVEGVAPQAKIMSVRAFRTKAGALPETTSELLLAAIDLAATNGARVLNMSFVCRRPDGHLQELLRTVASRGVILVASAGNDGPKAAPVYPAAYPEVIAVTAVDEADRRYEHANRGRYIAIAAPGVDILAPVEGGRHELVSGTSFATAYVSGIAALLLERDPRLNTAAVAQVIEAGADDIGPAGRDDDFGAGRINALAALEAIGAVTARR
jgi:subtilisin family serine protease